MKNKLRYLWMILLVISLVCAAAGCGRGDDGADSGTGEENRQSYVPKYMELDQGPLIRRAHGRLSKAFWRMRNTKLQTPSMTL